MAGLAQHLRIVNAQIGRMRVVTLPAGHIFLRMGALFPLREGFDVACATLPR